MNKNIRRKTSSTVVCAIAISMANGAQAVDFEIGDGWNANWTSSLSLGSSWRANSRDSSLYGQANGALLGLTNGTGANTIDEGNLNYDKGDAFSTQLKLISEIGISKGTMGAFFRGKAWYDFALKNSDVHYGNQVNGYNGYDLATNSLTEKRPLSDDGFEHLNQFSGLYLLDAYVYNTFDIADNPLQVRVGNQVLNWGESLFIQGINQINPIDVPSFRKPGAQVKEVFLPVPMVMANQTLGDFGEVEFFYQWKWRNTPIEAGCGNYWGVANGSIGIDPGQCTNGVGLAGSNALSHQVGAFIHTLRSEEPSNSGQFGMAFRTYAEAIDSEIGVYAMKIHSRTPAISVQFGDNTSSGSLMPFAVKWEYPEDIKIYGASITTNLFGWSIGTEVSHSKDVPAQIDGNDLLLSGLGAGGVIVPGVAVPFGPYGQAAMAAAAGDGYLTGFKLTDKTQFQFNAIKVGRNILKSDQYLFVGEFGLQWNDLDLGEDNLRYNRPFIFGAGPHATYGASCEALGNPSVEGCKNDGYITNFAWGYRMKMELTYNNVFNTGVTFKPSLFWSHDVKGWSVDSQFSEGRQTIGLGTKFSFAKKYEVGFDVVHFNNADYNPLRDRDFYSATIGMNF